MSRPTQERIRTWWRRNAVGPFITKREWDELDAAIRADERAVTAEEASDREALKRVLQGASREDISVTYDDVCSAILSEGFHRDAPPRSPAPPSGEAWKTDEKVQELFREAARLIRWYRHFYGAGVIHNDVPERLEAVAASVQGEDAVTTNSDQLATWLCKWRDEGTHGGHNDGEHVPCEQCVAHAEKLLEDSHA